MDGWRDNILKVLPYCGGAAGDDQMPAEVCGE